MHRKLVESNQTADSEMESKISPQIADFTHNIPLFFHSGQTNGTQPILSAGLYHKEACWENLTLPKTRESHLLRVCHEECRIGSVLKLLGREADIEACSGRSNCALSV